MSGCAAWSTLATDQIRSRILNSAVHSVWALTGHRWSSGERTVYPRTSCSCRAACSHDRCGQVDELDLRFYVQPFGTVVSGAVIDSDGVSAPLAANVDYWVANGILRPVDGGKLNPWPYQNDGAARGGPLTWSLTLGWGEVPPPEAVDAAADLACALARRHLGGPCEIPENAMSVSREGTVIKLTQGLLAIPAIRALVDAYPSTPSRVRNRRVLDPMKYTPAAMVDETVVTGSWSATGAIWSWGPNDCTPSTSMRLPRGRTWRSIIDMRGPDCLAASGDIRINAYRAQLRQQLSDTVPVATFTCSAVSANELLLEVLVPVTARLVNHIFDIEETIPGFPPQTIASFEATVFDPITR